MTRSRLRTAWLALALVAAIFLCAAWAFGWAPLPDLAALQVLQQRFAAAYAAHPVIVSLCYFFGFVLLTALCMPGAAILMLAAGASFGLLWGCLLSTAASAFGALLTMLAARHLLRSAVARRFAGRLQELDRGIARDGVTYMLLLRLIPVVPFVVVNLLAGLTRMRSWTFLWTSMLGMLPGTALYVNAGTHLGQMTSLESIFSPGLLASLAALVVLPMLLRQGLRQWRSRTGVGDSAKGSAP